MSTPPNPQGSPDPPDSPLADERHLLVRSTRWEADGIISLEMSDASGTKLWAWEPGAHVDVVLPSGLVRQYSLCSDPCDLQSYRLAVLLDPEGRGGSREVHATQLVGQRLLVRQPRNHFKLEPADHYVFLAGGVGITPMIPMVLDAERAGVRWTLVYRGRSRGSMAFLDELQRFGEHVLIVPSDEGPFVIGDLAPLLYPGTQVYCCGPLGMISAAEEWFEQHGRSDDLHVERFEAANDPSQFEPVDGEMNSFEVVLERSGQVVTVGPGMTILDAVRAVLPNAHSSCELGFCGTCETRVIDGVPAHHDTILSTAEQAAGRTVMICVGRSQSPRLVLDL